MINISDSNTIQFWLNGALSYNQEFVNFDPGVINKYCYHQKFLYGSEFRVRFTDIPSKTFRLKIFDEENNQLQELSFTETVISVTLAVYELFFNPVDINPLIKEANVYMQIVSFLSFNQSIPVISNSEFDTELSPWITQGVGQDWEWAGGKAQTIEASPAAEVSFVHYDFATTAMGWANTSSFPGVPLWGWSSDEGGSLKVLTSSGTYPPSEVVVNTGLPQQIFKFRIKYKFLCPIHSNTIILKLVVKDALNNNLFIWEFGGSSGCGTEHTAEVLVENPTIWLNATQLLITAVSSDFNTTDTIYITDIDVFTEGTAISYSKILVDYTIGLQSAGSYKLALKVESELGVPAIRYRIAVSNSTLNQQIIFDGYFSSYDDNPKIDSLDIFINNPFNLIYINMETFVPGLPLPQIKLDYLRLSYASPTTTQTVEAFTDQVIFTEEYFQYTELLYRSVKPFSQMYYDANSPYFRIVIPGVFFHERNTTQQKSIELSNSKIINTGSELKKQKLLTIDDAPDYFHNKILLILQHAVSGSVVINGVEWTIEENYDKPEPDETYSYPLKPASVYLTRKGYVIRNSN